LQALEAISLDGRNAQMPGIRRRFHQRVKPNPKQTCHAGAIRKVVTGK
jgi:hypothetical protein